MLAAVSTPSCSPSPQATVVSRDRDDACPGALRLHAADDGALARIRIPGGVLRADQAEVLGRAARDLGDGELHLTSRGNVQLRGLEPGCGADLADRLESVGLLPSWRHERVRNIVASPLSGLDGQGFADVRPWLRALDELLCASEAAARLSGRFLFALDDGRGDVAGLGADVTLRAAPGGGAWLRVGASDAVAAVRFEEAPRAAVLVAEVFLETTDGRAWRMSELAGQTGVLLSETVRRLPAAEPTARPAWRVTAEPPYGPVTAPDGTTSLSVLAPLGRLTAAQWSELTASAVHELRLTPWRGVILPTVPVSRLPHLTAVGLITDPTSPWVGVGACIGRPGCAKSHADVRTDAAASLTRADGLPVYWSGCERRCGRPRGDHVDVVAKDGGYQVSVIHDGFTRNTNHNPSSLAAAVTAARTHDHSHDQ
ncbi:precorrin-3B synthase [Streptomyces sp. S3(2020)]|uniref:precorrin-3B synthase n=1 Tax=Streptomyces sp. S3(2020) TaxID=2732044 RepID=UPI0014880297|nr:precorrin-3B synthase [Streptomyces sp. S3(2020)]NNN34807.1 precorrin-3B synthase [Streptomyces sp. S3(2020)]